MNIKIQARLAMVIAFAMLISIPTGCGSSGGGLSLEDLPLYPYATEGESMEQSGPGGFMGGKIAQFTTTDLFDEVLDFYTDALNMYNPQLISHTSDLGRQTAISIPKKNGMISVSIQEFTEEEIVNITFMAVGI
jgi:hypothetical protein